MASGRPPRSGRSSFQPWPWPRRLQVGVPPTAGGTYPGTVTGVVYQGCQFSWVCDGRSDRPRDGGAWSRALEVAAELLSRSVPDPTGGAMFVHAGWLLHPSFGPDVSRVAKIGRHVFYTRAERTPSLGPPHLLFASR